MHFLSRGVGTLSLKGVPFGFTNAVPAFQCIMKKLIDKHNLKYINTYLCNMTEGYMVQESLDANLQASKKAAGADHLTFNQSKCQCTVHKISC